MRKKLDTELRKDLERENYCLKKMIHDANAEHRKLLAKLHSFAQHNQSLEHK